MICVDDLRFRYRGAKNDAIAGLSLSIADGSLFGLLGPNGSGKTTLVSLLTGLLRADCGRIRIAGRDMPARRSEIQHTMALVPQEYAFYPSLSVRENLDLFASVQGLAGADKSSRVATAVQAAGLGDFLGKPARHLSGGLKRRLNLAIGLLNAPRLLILDEPTVGIDPQSRHFILESIRRIHESGTTIIYTSHYMEEVQTLCDEIAILDAGHVIAHGRLQDLLGTGEHASLEIGTGRGLRDAELQRLAPATALNADATGVQLDACTPMQLRTLLDQLADLDVAVTRIRYGDQDLEALFLRLTGHQLRD